MSAEPTTKTCSNPECRKTKPLEEFARHAYGVLGRKSRCKACLNAVKDRAGATRRWKEYKARNPELVLDSVLNTMYGITAAIYSELFEAQHGRCAICRRAGVNAIENPKASRASKLLVDHDHVSGLVRGLLCRHCNFGLGHFRDDPELLRTAVEYLGSHAAIMGKRRGFAGQRPPQKQSHCNRGHPFDEANTYVAPNGARSCRACMRRHWRAYDHRRRIANMSAVELLDFLMNATPRSLERRDG